MASAVACLKRHSGAPNQTFRFRPILLKNSAAVCGGPHAQFDAQGASDQAATSLSPWLNAPINSAEDGPGDAVLRTPITGIAFCCARAASGHAAITPPGKIMKLRRLMPGLSL